MREEIKLSKRLQAVAGMVTKGNVVCDVGCDHGFVSIYLLQKGISPRVISMDVNKGPLQAAKEHIGACCLTDYIETRLSDGVSALNLGEADALICAGMGGRLVIKILEEGKDKIRGMKELILQPQSDLQAVRKYLRGQGYLITDENMILEDGKYYPMMRVCPQADPVETCSRAAAMMESESGRKMGADGEVKQEAGRKPGADGEVKQEAGRKMGADGEVELEAGRKAETDSEIEPEQAERMQQRIADKFGPILLQKKHPVLKEFLHREYNICEQILDNLRTNGRESQERQQEILDKRKDIEAALNCF